MQKLPDFKILNGQENGRNKSSDFSNKKEQPRDGQRLDAFNGRKKRRKFLALMRVSTCRCGTERRGRVGKDCEISRGTLLQRRRSKRWGKVKRELIG